MMNLMKAIAVFATSAILSVPALAAPYEGVYTSSMLMNGIGTQVWRHQERNVVSGASVSGFHWFELVNPTESDLVTYGSFEWTGTLTRNAPGSATLSGSGTIHNLGDRSFTLNSGGLYLDRANSRYVLHWGGIDPEFGGIGGGSYLHVDLATLGLPTNSPSGGTSGGSSGGGSGSAQVPEPSALLLIGLALAGLGATRRQNRATS